MVRAFLALLGLIGLFSCAYLKNVKLLIDVEIKQKNYVQTLPFELKKDLIILKAKINSDTIEREFIFDTGAFNSKVEGGLAEELGLKVVTEKTNSTAQGVTKQIEVVRIDSLLLGEVSVYNLGAGKLFYAATSASQCVGAHGIIGANLIQLAHWKIDYEKQLIHFSDQPFTIDEKYYTLPFERPLLSGTPRSTLELQGKKIENVLVDIGYNGGLILPLGLSQSFSTETSRVVIDNSTSGIHGVNQDSIVIKDLALNWGDELFTLPVEFSYLGKGLLGNEFLKHFEVVINYDKNELYLKKVKQVKIAEPTNFSVAIANDSTWVVNRTTPSIALNIGDTLIEVNGKQPKDMFASYCDYVMNYKELMGKEYCTVIKADGSTFVVNQK